MLTILLLAQGLSVVVAATSIKSETILNDYSLTIYGNDSMNIYPNEARTRYSAILRGPEGEMSRGLKWSVAGVEGVSITQKGLLIVDPNAQEGTVVITVATTEAPRIQATRAVSLTYYDEALSNPAVKAMSDERNDMTTKNSEDSGTNQEPVSQSAHITSSTVLTQYQKELVEYLSKEIPSKTRHVEDKYIPSRDVSTQIADYVISWQLDYEGLGGWGKNFDDRIYSRQWNGSEIKSHTYTHDNKVPTSSIDNNATTSHIHYLAAVYGKYGGERYKKSIHKAMDMILHMQHEQGSWGEMYPEQTYGPSRFENRGTILQMVHYNNLSMYQKILNNTYPFNNDLFSEEDKAKIRKSYDKALDFVIKSQVKQDGVLTGWAGKYDEEIYQPRWARNFEPPSINAFDTAMILFHLISIPDKSDEITNAIYHGNMWMYNTVKLDMEYRSQEPPFFHTAPGMKMWNKFIDIQTNEGIYAAHSKILHHISELPVERLYGYGWASERGFQFYEVTDAFLRSHSPL